MRRNAARKSMEFEVVNRLFTYDPFTGEVRWSENPDDLREVYFRTRRRIAGKAISSIGGKKERPRLSVQLCGTKYYLHHIAWTLCWEQWPKEDIDHQDGDTLNSRIENLREASRSKNSKNQCRRKDNKSGVMGVRKIAGTGKWVATIASNKTRIHLGVFMTFEEAVEARLRAEEKYGFHKNHGRNPVYE